MSIRRGPIKSCTKRFAGLDQGRASSTPASFHRLHRFEACKALGEETTYGYVVPRTMSANSSHAPREPVLPACGSPPNRPDFAYSTPPLGGHGSGIIECVNPSTSPVHVKMDV